MSHTSKEDQMKRDAEIEERVREIRKVGDVAVSVGGLSKRELFSAMVMQGICSNPNFNPSEDIHFKNAISDAVSMGEDLEEALK